MDLIGSVGCDLEHLIDEVGIARQLVKRDLEQLKLQIEVHGVRGAKADQTGMLGDAGVLPLRARPICRPAEIDRVLGDEGPVAGEDNRLQLSVLAAGKTQPDHMRGFAVAAPLRQLGEVRAEALVHEELHAAALRRTTRRSVTIRAPAGNSTDRGRPRGGLAAA